jgi:hypothetical protein
MAVKLSKDAHHVLHIGDFDPSGEHIFNSLKEDIQAFSSSNVEFSRVAVTEAQGLQYNLPTAPPKKTDNRSFSGSATIQAEALPPATLAWILNEGILVNLDQTA